MMISYIYISQLNKYKLFPFFPSSINEKSKMAVTDKQKSSFRYIITNNEHKNTKSMSFVVSNPPERPEYHISMKKYR